MDPSSETAPEIHCIQSSTSSEQLHAKKTNGRTRKKVGGGRAGGAGGENKINKIGEICWELYKLDESLLAERLHYAIEKDPSCFDLPRP